MEEVHSLLIQLSDLRDTAKTISAKLPNIDGDASTDLQVSIGSLFLLLLNNNLTGNLIERYGPTVKHSRYGKECGYAKKYRRMFVEYGYILDIYDMIKKVESYNSEKATGTWKKITNQILEILIIYQNPNLQKALKLLRSKRK